MTVRTPLRILDELSTDQLQRLLQRVDETQPASSTSCPLALALDTRIGGAERAARLLEDAYVERHPQSDGMILRDWAERFIDWWDEPVKAEGFGGMSTDGGLVIQRRKTLERGIRVRLAKRGVE